MQIFANWYMALFILNSELLFSNDSENSLRNIAQKSKAKYVLSNLS
jgi:hypothetical protein